MVSGTNPRALRRRRGDRQRSGRALRAALRSGAGAITLLTFSDELEMIGTSFSCVLRLSNSDLRRGSCRREVTTDDQGGINRRGGQEREDQQSCGKRGRRRHL